MTKVKRQTRDEIERLRLELQALRSFIADLEDRALDGIDSLLSVAQAELERIVNERGDG